MSRFVRAMSAVAVLAAGVCAASGAHAQAASYPSKTIRMVIALAPGGGVDTTGRFIAQKLNQAWGQPVVADNRPGAGGSLAAELVAKAPADGYTLLMTSSGITITPSIMKLNYDAHKELLPVTLAVVSPGVLVVHPSVPAKNVKELVAFARARPNELFYSSSGQGSGQHLAMAMLCQMTGVKMTHVPYKGTAPSITDVIAGRIATTIASVISTRPQFTTGKLRALATVGFKRSPALPDMPTVAEQGVPGFGYENWYALFAPGGTDKGVATKIQAQVAKALQEPDTRKLMEGQGLDVVASTVDDFGKMYTAEIARWSKVVKSVGLEPN